MKFGCEKVEKVVAKPENSDNNHLFSPFFTMFLTHKRRTKCRPVQNESISRNSLILHQTTKFGM